jgi:hypothetical protein
MNIARRWTLAIPLSALLGIGCGSNDPMAPATTDTEARQTATEELSRHPELVEDGLYDIQTQAQTQVGASAIDPLFFWRDIRRVARTFDVAFADTDSTGQPATAIITVHKRFAGNFNIVVGDGSPEGSPTDAHVIHKPLRDHWVRRVLLKRVAKIDGHERRPWRVAAVSGVEVTSRDAQTRLQSVRIQSGDLDTTITHPLAFWRLRRLVHLDPEASVTLTVTTQAADDVVILYARGMRSRFHNNGDGTHTITWNTGVLDGLRHFGVNALSHDTLFDDEAPYDSQTWILPYVVGPTEMADLAS